MSSKRRSSELLQEARAFRVAKSDTDFSIFNFLSSVNTPKSLAVWLLYKHKEHDQLTTIECLPEHYNNAFRFRLDYTAASFLSKASFLKTSFNRTEVAMKKFEEFEILCRATNNRFRNPQLDPLNHGPNVWLLNATKRKIAEILGDYSGEEFVNEGNWGPGVSTLVKGEEVSAFNKFRDERGITRDLYSLVEPWFAIAYPSWWRDLSLNKGENPFIFEVGNEIVTVPKNSKTDRVIAIEPGINSWFQKAIGGMIRKRLSRSGVDLAHQSHNQYLAYLGSKESGSATVDFSSASDSIAVEVVRELLPPRWFQLLDSCRCHLGKTSTQVRRWEKFSSMGNGFTFELESLIFYAAALSVTEYEHSRGEVSVYGDDVILPQTSFRLFSSFSEFLGFRVNSKKSFFSGYFRESCGNHYYDGVDCKPIFLKEKLQNVEAFYKLANNVRRLAHRYNFNRSCDSRFLDCWSHLFLRVPEPLRLFVPIEAGDTGFIGNFDEACPVRARNGIEGYYFRALTSVGVSRQSEQSAQLLARLWQLQSPAPKILRGWRGPSQLLVVTASKLPLLSYGNSYDLKGRSRRVITKSLTCQWYNLGPWD